MIVLRPSLVCAAGVISVATGPATQAQPETTDITVEVRTPNAVRVEEHSLRGPTTAALELRVLSRPCMVIEHLRVERDGEALAGVVDSVGPWIVWRDTTPIRGDPLRLKVGYDVWLGGSRTIPLAYLTSPAPSGPGAVTVTVRFAPRAALAAQVKFPRLTRQASGDWSNRFIAIPSFVKVGGPAFPCDRLPPPGDNGGLVWRFTLLVGIMVAWVPLYLAWARRSGESA